MDWSGGELRLMSTRDIVQQTFDEFAKSVGGIKESGSWYVSSQESIAVLNLQKSQYATSYYVNVSFWLRAVGTDDAPKPSRCQIQTRLGQIAPVELGNHLTDLLDLQSPIDEELRRNNLLRFLREYLVPAMNLGATLDGLRSPEGQHLLKNCLVDRDAQRLVALTHP
jgi:Domain of unknown function (DUF4304)